MPVKIRLARRGARNLPYYHIVVSSSRSPRDGRFIEKIGTYDPRKDPVEVTIKKDRLEYWLNQGAQLTQIVKELIKKYEKQKQN